jgi:phage terminase large subunit-like protein
MQRDWGLPIVDFNPGRSSKGERFEKTMAPLFERGVARVVNVESPFLRTFREEWLRWPQGEHDDCLDAVYYMIMAAQSYVRGQERKGRTASPFAELGRL